MNAIKDAIDSSTFGDYYSASDRLATTDADMNHPEEPYNVYSFENIKTVLSCASKLLTSILVPFVLLFLFSYLFAVARNINPFTLILLGLSINQVLRHFYGVIIKSPFGRLFRPFNARYAPGVYAATDTGTQRLLSLCPSLRHDGVIFGDLFDSRENEVIRATPWLLSGDLRTLLPFLTVQPPTVTYHRRWVRVPLSDYNGICKEESKDTYEAVALDWMAPLSTENNDSEKSQEPIKAVFLLAGLTGGSQEGYVKDFVHHARAQGTHVFVMVGRGLQNCPIASDSLFHGARISDALACAKVIRNCLGKNAVVIAVGISMGGFVVTNALVKSELSEYVDGVVNVAGCFDTFANLNFSHSRELWQPLLTFGLKEGFAASKKGWEVIKRRFGSFVTNSNSQTASQRKKIHDHCSGLVDRLVDVYDFDTILVTGIHGYKSVEDYYANMSAAPTMREIAAANVAPLRFPVPLLVIHALDDPVIHADSIPADPLKANQPWVWENSIMLLTAMGGHMGWPLGWLPWASGFRFTNTVVMDFLEGIYTCKFSPVSEIRGSNFCFISSATAAASSAVEAAAVPLTTSFRDATFE